jgi:MinD-like ATPase involved in chromosome partitioning or flagellar assembly
MQGKSIAALTLTFVICLAAIAGERQQQRVVVDTDSDADNKPVRVIEE